MAPTKVKEKLAPAWKKAFVWVGKVPAWTDVAPGAAHVWL